jgi:hypothetical protein
MKKIYILLLFSIFLSNLFGQVTLTFRNNGMLAGDSSRTYEISYVDPGNPGENQVWNFSGIQYTGKTTFGGVDRDLSLKTTGTAEQGMVISEDGYNYSYLAGENGYEETGYVNSGKKLVLNYSDPIVKMKYPLSYGQQFSDPFAGVAWYNEKSRTDLSGNYNLTADAYGTLILPDRILKNTLRINTVKQSLQVGVCGSTQSKIVKYYWFAPGYRYPVLMVCTNESRYSGKEPVVVKSAWVNLDQRMSGTDAPVADAKKQAETGENSVIVYPNPFSEQLTYNYFLRKQVPVMVDLYDMSGKFNIRVEKKQLQAEGLHTGFLNASLLGIPPGIYYLRFMFDRQVVVSKIVKI